MCAIFDDNFGAPYEVHRTLPIDWFRGSRMLQFACRQSTGRASYRLAYHTSDSAWNEDTLTMNSGPRPSRIDFGHVRHL